MTFAGERAAHARRLLVGGIALVTVAAGLTACSAEPPGPGRARRRRSRPRSRPATSPRRRSPAGTADATAATAARTAAYEGLAPWEPQVAVVSTTMDEKDKDLATATLGYTWDVDESDADWTYETHAKLARDDEDVWHATWSPSLLAPDLVAGEVLTVERARADRANVLGAGGAVIVEPRPVHRLGIDKTRVAAPEQDAAARALARALGIDADAYAAQGRRRRARRRSSRRSRSATATSATTSPALAAMPGVNDVTDTLPLAPSRAVRPPDPRDGRTGATAEIIEKSDGAVAAGDLAGLSGLQRQYDAQLRGLPGLTITASQAGRRRAARSCTRSSPTPGTPADDHARRRPAGGGRDRASRRSGPASAVVAIRPSTGDVLAAASGAGRRGDVDRDARPVRPGLDVQGGVRAGAAAVRADRRQRHHVPGDGHGRRARRSATSPSTRRTSWAPSRCGPPSPTRATPPSSRARDAADQDALIDAAGSLGPRSRTPRSGSPRSSGTSRATRTAPTTPRR